MLWAWAGETSQSHVHAANHNPRTAAGRHAHPCRTARAPASLSEGPSEPEGRRPLKGLHCRAGTGRQAEPLVAGGTEAGTGPRGPHHGPLVRSRHPRPWLGSLGVAAPESAGSAHQLLLPGEHTLSWWSPCPGRRARAGWGPGADRLPTHVIQAQPRLARLQLPLRPASWWGGGFSATPTSRPSQTLTAPPAWLGMSLRGD